MISLIITPCEQKFENLPPIVQEENRDVLQAVEDARLKNLIAYT